MCSTTNPAVSGGWRDQTMKMNQRQVALSAAFILPLAAMATWLGLPERTQSDFPVDLEGQVMVTETSFQVPSNPVVLKNPRAPVQHFMSAESDRRSSTAGEERVDEKETASDGGVCVYVKGADKHLGDHGQGLVRITRLTPKLPTWSADALVVDGAAQFSALPQGTFRVDFLSSTLNVNARETLVWPAPDGKHFNLFEVDLDQAIAEAQENTVIATLRSIAGAQQQVQASAAIDTDGDGGGQYAFLGELAGSSPMRIFGPGGGSPGGPENVMNPPFLSKSLGEVEAASQYGCVLRQGYYFRVHLPALTQSDDEPVTGVYESAQGGAGLDPVDPSLGERFWGIYAWPAAADATTSSAFFINQEGDMVRSQASAGNPYIGLNAGPAFDAAHSTESPRDMRGQLGIAAMGRSANDGGIWLQVGR
jgi:hypothetical protein